MVNLKKSNAGRYQCTATYTPMSDSVQPAPKVLTMKEELKLVVNEDSKSDRVTQKPGNSDSGGMKVLEV